MAKNPKIQLHLFDGARRPLTADFKYLVRLINGHQKQVHADSHQGQPKTFEIESYFDNFGDNYTVIVSAKRHHDAAFAPVKVDPGRTLDLHLMLLPKRSRYDFTQAAWPLLRKRDPQLVELLKSGLSSQAEAIARYEELLDGAESKQHVAATLHNVTTALKQVTLPNGRKPLDYYKQLIWDAPEPKPDRFFAFADPELLAQLDQAPDQFSNSFGHGLVHPGSTRSLKQTQFGEANVQLTFYENDRKEIGGVTHIRVEADIDYYKDPLAHFFLELIPNSVTKGKTSPKLTYLLRWIATRRAGEAEFAPPYAIVAAE
ncbi:MAG: hypothetical protein SF339_18950 [Blastocatellia bacterium]|nr:hypothetical protein [Blastocatellia bacterium]